MSGQRTWPIRYQFLRELWSGRDRLLVDNELEDVLTGGEAPYLRGAVQEGDGLRRLFDELIPAEASEETVWMLVRAERRVAEYSRMRGGTGFATLEEARDIGDSGGWQIAIVETSEVLASVPDDAEWDGLSGFEVPWENLFLMLREGVEEGRAVALGCSAGKEFDDRFTILIDAQFPGARLYGLSVPTTAAVIEFTDGAGDDEVEVAHDNSLGDGEPVIIAWLAVIGDPAHLEVPTGLTLIELPTGSLGARSSGDADSAVRAQLEESHRHVELAAIENQRLLEALEEQRLRSDSQDESEAPASRPDGVRLDAALAREKAARWQIERLESELAQARGRAATELEAEVALLRRDAQTPRKVAPASVSVPAESGLTGRAQRSIDATLVQLIGRVERGGMQASELWRGLHELRATLRGR